MSLRRLARDFLAEQLGLESKVPTTLWTLISRPGLLTKEYLAGRRVRSLLPLRLYLSASVVYFLLLALPMFGKDLNIRMTAPDRAAVDSSGADSAVVSSAGDTTRVATFGTIDRANIAAAKPKKGLERFVQQRMKRFEKMSGPEIIAYFKASFVRYMPNAIFLLLPVFSLLLYLLYRKTGRFFAEHLIFTLHIHAFAFVALIISLFLPEFLDIVAPVWILVYLFIALRGVYGESRGRTAAKFAALVFSYMLIFQITMLAVLGAIFAYG
ncbi:MAG: DUF3667 domain-containing protein [Gemmatimonadales bacterium]